jgi:hypothetical protein
MKVSAQSVQARAQFLQNAISGLGSGQVSRNQLPSQGLSQNDMQTLQAAFDYLAKRGVVTPQNMNSLLGQAAQNATRADTNGDGFISDKEQQNGLGSVSRPLVRAAADGFDNANATAAAGSSSAATQGGNAGAQNINNALNKLDVEHNRKYLPTGQRGTSSRVTHCNQFAQDALKGIGVPKSAIPGGNANNMNNWLNSSKGQQAGWHKVSAADAQKMANAGHPVLASWKNNSGPHGHVAVVRPGHDDGKVHIAQAGGTNHSDTTVNKGFGKHQPEYFVYDGPVNGKAQAPTAGSRAAPSSAAPAGSAAPGASVADAAARAAAAGATNGANAGRPITGLNAALMLGNKPKVSLKAGEAAVDLNGTKYTSIEGRAADNNISIQSKRKFDPLTEPGIALTTAQAKALGVKVGDSVNVRDTKTGKTVSAVYYDNAGTKPDGMKHFEVDPALADQLGINYRNRRGNVVDAVTNSSQVDNRFVIEK